MSSGVNKAIIVGNLGKDPELRHTQNGNSVCQLSVATTRKYTNRNNDVVEETEWHRVVVWGKSAEHCNTYLTVGRQVYVEGRIQTRSYTDNDGTKRYSTEIVADSVQFLGSASGNGRREHRGGNTDRVAAHEDFKAPPPDLDDIPF